MLDPRWVLVKLVGWLSNQDWSRVGGVIVDLGRGEEDKAKKVIFKECLQ